MADGSIRLVAYVHRVTTQTSGPLALGERALGPDLARGVMLLFIALANSHYFLAGTYIRGGFPMGGSAVDNAVIWFIATFVDGRAFPMFGLLFGYGVAQIVRRQQGFGRRGVRHLLWRRSAALMLIGFTHGMLLYVGDILGAYGVLLFFGVWALRWSDRWLLGVAVAIFVLTAMPSADSLSISTDGPDPSMLPPDLASMLTERIVVVPFIMLLGPIGFLCPFLVGMWFGRRRALERPGQYRRLLTVTAVVGISAAVLGAQPIALMLSGVTRVPSQSTLELIGPMHDATGVLGGFGYAALITLLAHRLGGRRPRIVEAIAATGQRSMTFYLAQSVVWTVVFTPFLLGLADELSVAVTALLAAATWTTTVVSADWMRRTGRRGPFEQLMRRVTYVTASAVPVSPPKQVPPR